MAVSIRTWVAFDVQAGTSIYRGGSVQQPVVLFNALGTAVHDRTVIVGASSTATLLDLAGAGEPASFAFLFLSSDQDVMIETQGTTTADNSHFLLSANVPIMMAGDDTRAYNAAGSFAGALQVVKKILVRNDSGLLSANVRCFAML